MALIGMKSRTSQ